MQASGHKFVTLSTIKAAAKRIKKDQPHLHLTTAQDIAAKGFGFHNFIHAERELSPRRNALATYASALDYYARAIRQDLGGRVGDEPVATADGSVLPYVAAARCPEWLSDRWGDMQDGDAEAGIPANDLALLRGMLRDEISAIARADGQLGVLYGLDFGHDRDGLTEQANDLGMPLKPETAVLAEMGTRFQHLAAKYPQAKVFLTSGAYVFGGRVGVFAFVPAGALDAAALDALERDLFATSSGSAAPASQTGRATLPPLQMELQSKQPHTTPSLVVTYPEGADISRLETALAGIGFESDPWGAPPFNGEAEAVFSREGSDLFREWTPAERELYLMELADVLAAFGLSLPRWRKLTLIDLL